MTRIIGGAAGGRPIRTPSGEGTRPTADRVREALFSSLESALGTLYGATLLDVFAGSGAVGLEAASRGAAWVTFVEQERPVAAVISANAAALGFRDIDVRVGPAAVVGAGRPRLVFTVAFFDPPYEVTNESLAQTLTAFADAGWLADGAVAVLERSRRSPRWEWPAGFTADRDRRYGDTILWYGRWEPPREVAVPAPPDEES